jgi:DNA polymerase-3 subunit delta
MTLAIGRRFVIVDGVERWKDADVSRSLAGILEAMPPDTTVAFFAREEGRQRAPETLATAVTAAGGDVSVEARLKPRELPRWLIGQAKRLGIHLDTAAAQALLADVGERQQRLLRELEKLALEHGEGARIGVEEVEAVAAHSAERQVWSLVDALVARDAPRATQAFLDLRGQGEALARLIPLIARRLRDVLAIASALEAGEPPARIKQRMGGSGWAAERRMGEARAADAESLRRALETLAQLELDTRGASDLAEETGALLAIRRMAA